MTGRDHPTKRLSHGRVTRILQLVHGGMAMGLLLVHVRAGETEAADHGFSPTRNHDLSAEAAAAAESPPPPPLWERLAGGPTQWTALDKVLFAALIMLAMEILNLLCTHSGDWIQSKRIPVRGKHLDDLRPIDRLFIGISKAQTGPFLYLLLRYCFSEQRILWDFQDASLRNIVLPLPALFIVYDFFYTILHWFLHIKAVYPLIHKHHHHQKAPSRATNDAVNVHPVEFTLGEYNHLLAIYLCCHHLHLRVHICGVLAFLAVGGILSGWNHTRFDITWNVLGIKVFDSKAHDVHHRIPQSNYGQYTMFWDTVFGTYRPYDPTDRVNPQAQLDPATGKSLEYNKKAVKAT